MSTGTIRCTTWAKCLWVGQAGKGDPQKGRSQPWVAWGRASGAGGMHTGRKKGPKTLGTQQV